MNVTIVRYKVKADRAAENIAFIAAVFEELKAAAPPGLHYGSFQLEDGVSFVHIAALDDGVEANPLPATAAFKRFVADIKARCDEPPAASAAAAIGAYKLMG